MSYELKLVIDEDVEKIYNCLKIEKINRDRSSLQIKKTKNLEINITASDPTALRATFDGIIKLIITYNKMKLVK